MSDNERPRDSRRDNRGDRERGGTPGERRNRSRSPRRERGGRRDNRYRSRSPFKRDEREGDRSDRGRGDHNRGRGRDNRNRNFSDRDRARSPPKGPRSSAAPASRSNGGSNTAKPPSGPRSSEYIKREESPDDVEMKEDVNKRPKDMDDETWEMMTTMGFAGFKSTKNTKVPGNDKNYAVRRDKRLEARQYMNRQGGFNRPLSPSRG